MYGYFFCVVQTVSGFEIAKKSPTTNEFQIIRDYPFVYPWITRKKEGTFL